MRVADLEVDESEVAAVASAVSAVHARVGLDRALTRGSLDAVGAVRVAEVLDSVTERFARRVELLRDVLERLGRFPDAFVHEVSRTEAGLVSSLAADGGAGAGGPESAGGVATSSGRR